MNRRPKPLFLICLIGLLASLIGASGVLAAMRRVARQSIVRSYTPLSGEAEWEGDWEFSALGADPSEVGTERVAIPFVGTDFALQVRRGDYRGYFYVSVDGEPANLLPWDDRGAYLVLTSPDRAPQVASIPVATGLLDGPHLARIAVERGWDQWPLAGWSVTRAPDTTAYRWALAGLGTLGLVCLGGIVWWVGRKTPNSKLQTPNSRGQIPNSKLQTSISNLHSPSSIFHPPSSILRLPSSILHLPSSLLLPVGDGPALVAGLAAAVAFYFSPWLPLTLLSGLALGVLVVLRLDLTSPPG